jgi:hypothetical protein
VVAARVVESLVRARVVGETGPHQFSVSTEGGSWLGQRVSGAFITLLLPSYGQFGAGDIALVLGVTCVIAAAVIARRRPDDRSGLLLFGGLAVGLLTVRLFLLAGPVPGIVWTAPLLGAGAVLFTRRLLEHRGVALLAGVIVLFAGAVLLTQYGSGGVNEWGWRYFARVRVDAGGRRWRAGRRHHAVGHDRPLQLGPRARDAVARDRADGPIPGRGVPRAHRVARRRSADLRHE